MLLKKIIFIIIVVLICKVNFAQNQLNFIVKDSITSELMPGVNVIETGTLNGAATDVNGLAKLKIQKKGFVDFSFQFIGYQLKNLKLNVDTKDSVFVVLLHAIATDIDEVVISSVRTNSRIENIPTLIEVLGVDDLNEENGIKPGNILSILGDMAGVQMQQTSISSGNSYARIQGLNGRYTQILKDGIPLFGGMSGNFGIMQIPPLDLHQIEIIKGSCATLYGGDAIGGIINLISKMPRKEQEIGFTVNQTSLKENNVNFFASKRYKNIGYTIFAGNTYQKESDIDKDSLTDVPKINSFVIHPRLLFYLNSKSTLTVNYSGTFDIRSGGEIKYFESLASDTLYHVKSKINRNNADIKYVNNFSDNKNLTVKISSSFFDQNLDTKYYKFNAKQFLFYSEVSYFVQLKKMNWVSGFNLNSDKSDNQSLQINAIDNYNFHTLGMFVQNTYNPTEKLCIESGFRLDYNTNYNFYPLPRLSVLYRFNKVFSARVNGGLGYKNPNVLTYIDTETELNKLIQQKSLKAELSQGINADLNFLKILADNFIVNINQSFYFTNLNSPVYSNDIGNGKIVLLNAAQAVQTKGMQTYSRITYKNTELYLSYAYTDVVKKYDNIHPEVIATPKHNLSGVIVFEFEENIRFGLESSYIAGQLNQDYQACKNYFLMAAMIQYSLGNFSFVLNAENLLDFRQSKYEKVFEGSVSNPVFHQLWAPVDGRVVNFSVNWKLKKP